MCPGSPWNAFFPPDLFINFFFFVHPAKKRNFFIFRKDYVDQNEASPFFVLFEVIVQPCWHASLVQELILLSICLLEQSTCIFLYEEKQGVYLMKEILYFFSIRKEPLHFFPISVCWAPILQLFRRCPGNNYCRYLAAILTIIGKPPGLGGAEQPVCQAKKRLQAILRIESNFEGVYSSSQDRKPITRNWTFLLHC